MGGTCQSVELTDKVDLGINILNYEEEKKHFYVISVLQNPSRSRSIMKNHLKFQRQMKHYGIKLITVECVSDNAPFALTQINNEPNHIQIKASDVFFFEENLINIAISKLPPDAKYVAWCNCDINFTNSHWVEDTINSLKTFKAVQLFERIFYTDNEGNEVEQSKGFAARLFGRKKENDSVEKILKENTIESKYAWGFRYEVLKELGGLIDFSPIGNNHKIMAYCLANMAEQYIPIGISFPFKEAIEEWQNNAREVLRNNIGFVIGAIQVPLSKAKKESEVYDNWPLLQDHKFNQVNDLYKNKDGLYCFEKGRKHLADDLKAYFNTVHKELNN